jgi:hypothetical protein
LVGVCDIAKSGRIIRDKYTRSLGILYRSNVIIDMLTK